MPTSRATKQRAFSWQIIGFWGGLRGLLGLWAALVSELHPLTEVELAVALWPPIAPVGRWLERVLLAPWMRWDVEWYLRILTEGYQFGNGTDAFHPLFPWLALPLTSMGIHPLLALLFVASLSSAAFLLVFERLAALDVSPAAARTATQLLLFFPAAFVLFAPYTEGLFLLFAALMFWWARQRRWWWAGAAGALAVLTRQQGIVLIIPFVWELWEAHDHSIRDALRDWRGWLASGLIPGGLAAWALYRALVIGGMQFDFTSLYSLAYSMFIAPSAVNVVPAQVMIWPWQALQLALVRVWSEPDLDLLVNLVLAALFIGGVILAWRKLRPSYRVYVLLVTLISISYHTGYVHPYMGLPRHLFLAFPIFIGLGPRVQRLWQRLAIVGAGFAGICFLTMLYVLEAWVP